MEHISVYCFLCPANLPNLLMSSGSFLGFPGGIMVKNLPANAGDLGSIPGSGRFPGVENDSSFSILVWKIPWTEGPGGLQCMVSQRVRYNSTHHLHTHMAR